MSDLQGLLNTAVYSLPHKLFLFFRRTFAFFLIDIIKLLCFLLYRKPPATSYIFASFGGFYACGIVKKDTIYVPMPLHHMSGGCMGAGMTLLFGLTAVLRKKFSVTNFWSDCNKYGCTVVFGVHLNFIGRKFVKIAIVKHSYSALDDD